MLPPPQSTQFNAPATSYARRQKLSDLKRQTADLSHDEFSSHPSPKLILPPPKPAGPPTIFSKLLGDRSRASLGIILEDIVPPMLGFAFVAGPIGWAITLSSPLLSYASGKLGRYIARDVSLHNLPSSMQKLQDFRKALNGRENLKEGELVDKWNQFIDDALNIKVSRFKGIANFALNRLKISQTGFVGKILNNPNFLKAKMYSNISHANSMGGAVKAGTKGGISFWFYQYFLPGVGKVLEKIANILPGPLKWPFKLLGWLMDHFPSLKLAKDMLLPGRKELPPT
jgi:hypothetical protein